MRVNITADTSTTFAHLVFDNYLRNSVEALTLIEPGSGLGEGMDDLEPFQPAEYVRALLGIASAIGIGTDYRSVGAAETEILKALEASPALLIIDEANHFSKDSLNFLKTILNETRCAIVLLTLPGHLARIAATHSEETRQLLRRAVSIVHIGQVSSADVMAIHSGLYPEIHLGHAAPSIASCANRHYRMDTVRRIFEEADPHDADDLPRAVERVERSIKTILQA